MSAIEPGLWSALTDDATVSGLVASRVYPFVIPEGVAMPAIVYQRVSTEFVQDINDASSLSAARAQITSWSETYLQAKTLSAAVRAVIENFTGTWNSLTVQAVDLEDESDIFEPAPSLQQRRRYGVRQDYSMWYAE